MLRLEKYSKELVNVPCSLCQADDTELLCLEQRFQTNIPVVICKRCGLIYLNPRWSGEAYARFYQEDYRQLMGKSSREPKEIALMQRIHGSQILSFCSDFIKSGINVLDIGCAAGGILWIFREAKECHVVGVEPSIRESTYAREQLGIDVKSGVLEKVELPDSFFDLVILTQTLNHLVDPSTSLKRIRNLLKPKGKLFVEVQNFLEFKRTQVDHLYYFTPETLECMLRKVGFDILKTEVDTAGKAKLVSNYMWHRGAFIHIRMLAEKSESGSEMPYPEYEPIRDIIQSSFARPKPTILGRLIAKIVRYVYCHKA